MHSSKTQNSWRDFQEDYIQRGRKQTLSRRICRIAGIIFMAIMVCALIFFGMKAVPELTHLFSFGDPAHKTEETRPPIHIKKQAVKEIVRDLDILNAQTDQFSAENQSSRWTIHTHLDTRLQTELTSTLDRLKTLDRGKPERIAMVAMDGKTGFITAMAGFDLKNPEANPCTISIYPAASLFKIVTASAAVETLDYKADTRLYYNGGKYTLYKRQLTDKKNKYTNRVTMGKAFAESINPVFGKIGKLSLGRQTLNEFAQKFGFNQNPETDFDFPEARFTVTESDYHLAELGCGFNHDTLISPVFALTMVSAVVNNGHSLVPRLVDTISDSSQEPIYKSRKEIYKSPISPETAAEMAKIMERTVTAGTARKAFRGCSRDKVLSGLVIGGKTGSLFNQEHTVKYDWFTGFGCQKETEETLIVAVVVGHRKYIGTKACHHARNMLKTYFTHLAKTKETLAATSDIPE